MSLQSQISDVVTRIATEFKTVKTKLSGNNSGDLSGLTTSVKTSLLAAINELVSSLSGKEDTLGFTPEDSANKGAANGYAPLDASAKVPAANLPAFVDDVREAADFASLPGTGDTGVIYVTLDDNKVYRWSGSAYVEISSSLALGETSGTAYRGDRGKSAYDHSQLAAGNPHAVTFAQLGNKPTTLGGFGITDAYTKTEIGSVTQNFVTEFEAALV
jgi:hypothetical protein